MFATLFLTTCLTGSAIADVVALRPVADSSVYFDANSQLSNSRGQFLFAGNSGGGGTRRALLKFDFAGLPPGIQISSVELVLTISRQGPNATTASISRCVTAWTEGSSLATGEEGGGANATPGDPTWNFAAFDSRAWNLPGGDFTNVPADIIDVAGLTAVSFGGPALAGDVHSWIVAPPTNHGWIIQGDEAAWGTATRFGSRENADPDSQPILYITFSPQCPADFNHDETVDFFDYLDFVAALAGDNADADFNGDQLVDFFDYLDFVSAFASGC